MSQPSETIRFYDDHADEYVGDAVNINMESLYKPFLELLRPAARILDAGCGSGRDTKAFLDRGYYVTAIDASARMAEATAALTGTQPLQMLLEEIDFQDEFDGIWACASLLHVPRNQVTDEPTLNSCLTEHSGLEMLRSWVTDDVRADRNDRWVNALARKIGG